MVIFNIILFNYDDINADHSYPKDVKNIEVGDTDNVIVSSIVSDNIDGRCKSERHIFIKKIYKLVQSYYKKKINDIRIVIDLTHINHDSYNIFHFDNGNINSKCSVKFIDLSLTEQYIHYFTIFGIYTFNIIFDSIKFNIFYPNNKNHIFRIYDRTKEKMRKRLQNKLMMGKSR